MSTPASTETTEVPASAVKERYHVRLYREQQGRLLLAGRAGGLSGETSCKPIAGCWPGSAVHQCSRQKDQAVNSTKGEGALLGHRAGRRPGGLEGGLSRQTGAL